MVRTGIPWETHTHTPQDRPLAEGPVASETRRSILHWFILPWREHPSTRSLVVWHPSNGRQATLPLLPVHTVSLLPPEAIAEDGQGPGLECTPSQEPYWIGSRIPHGGWRAGTCQRETQNRWSSHECTYEYSTLVALTRKEEHQGKCSRIVKGGREVQPNGARHPSGYLPRPSNKNNDLSQTRQIGWIVPRTFRMAGEKQIFIYDMLRQSTERRERRVNSVPSLVSSLFLHADRLGRCWISVS
ncbi:hypothetical protein VTK73DRAFT_1204 [Phialemonium thermophilum]|uniref:Uncharacterized protein n=1 Tax=Phialemonium thermophilum TaxID=223376 RepID=A0ABR3VTT0_9PEZI